MTKSKLLFFYLLFSVKTAMSQNKAAEECLKYDWASLNRFREANKTLAFAKKEEQRVVVFIGDSITEGWIPAMPSFFTKEDYINRGIGGQTTGQVLVRFRPDVINLTPNVVVLMIGINDIAENNGTYNEEESFGNIVSMLQLAQANQIKAILCSITPADKFIWRTNILAVSDKIISLNKRLKNYALQNGITYCDYHSAMVDSKNAMQSNYTTDGVHVTTVGYQLMSELIEPLIQKEMTKK
jgi:lysophospholipase L1-like esterase